MPRKAKRPKKEERINWYVVGAFVIFLIGITVFLYFFQPTLPCPEMPKEIPEQGPFWFDLVHPKANRAKYVNYTALRLLPHDLQSKMPRTLIYLKDINMTSEDVEWVLEVEFPFMYKSINVNLIKASTPSATKLLDLLRSKATLIKEVNGIEIYRCPLPTSKFGEQGFAYLVVRGDIVYYSEGGLDSLKRLESYLTLKGHNEKLDDRLYTNGYYVTRSLGSLPLTTAVTFYDPSRAKNALASWRTATYDEDKVLVLQAVVFQDSKTAESSFKDAKTIFFSPNQKVCLVENMLTSVQKYDLEDIDEALLGV